MTCLELSMENIKRLIKIKAAKLEQTCAVLKYQKEHKEGLKQILGHSRNQCVACMSKG